EAGCMPPAHSLIADMFTRTERPRAVARYMLGVPVSVVLGLFFAGWLNELFGWRTMFVVLGLPGLALAAVVWLTVREPRRDSPNHDLQQPQAQVSQQEAWSRLWRNGTFRRLLIAYSIMSFFNYGIVQ